MIRTQETNSGNFVVDCLRAHHNSDICLLNSGSLRADKLFVSGTFKQRDLRALLPMLDELCILEMTGEQVYDALENSVSMYPKLEGRFAQVSTAFVLLFFSRKNVS